MKSTTFLILTVTFALSANFLFDSCSYSGDDSLGTKNKEPGSDLQFSTVYSKGNVPAIIINGKIITSKGGSVLINGNPIDTLDIAKGSNKITTADRVVSEFDCIRLEGSASATVKVGEPKKLQITIDDNLQNVITSEVEGKTLVIGVKQSYSCEHPPVIEIAVPDLRAVDLTGSCQLKIDGLTGNNFTAKLSNSANLSANGTIDTSSIELTGAARVDLTKLQTRCVEIKVGEAGTAKLAVTESLKANVSGAGKVSYLGKPKHLEIHRAEAGSVIAI